MIDLAAIEARADTSTAQEIRMLRDIVFAHGRHFDYCPSNDQRRGPCTCGFGNILGDMIERMLVADDYATWRPAAESDWSDEYYRVKFERLGAAGEVYFQELRAEIQRLRAALDTYGEHDIECACLLNPIADCTCGYAETRRVLLDGYDVAQQTLGEQALNVQVDG